MRTRGGVFVLALLVLALGVGWGSRGGEATGGAAPRLDGRIAFISAGNVVQWTGGRATRLTSNGHDSGAALAPDGSGIAFARLDPIGWSDLYLVLSSGGPAQALTDNRPGPNSEVGSPGYAERSLWMLQPAWAADGSQLAFVSDAGTPELALWLAEGDGQGRRRFATLDGGIEHPAWAPGGAEIAATTYKSGRAEVWSVRLATGEWREVAAPPDGAYDPAWSPDGRWIAYTARTGRGHDLWAVPADASSPAVRLTNQGHARSPAWSPDSAHLAFLAEHDSQFDLYVLDLNTGNNSLRAGGPQQVTNGAAIDAAGGLTWSR